MTAVLAAVAYASLPYWAPTGAIGRRLAAEMSRQMGTDVRIGQVAMSWSRGIELRDLEIDSPDGFDESVMVHVERIRADLSPIDMFLHDRIGWMSIDRPTATVQLDEDGNINIAALSKLHFDAQAEQISVSGASASVVLPATDKRLLIAVSDARYVAGRLANLGKVTVSAALKQDPSDAAVSVRLAGAGANRAAMASALLGFSNLDLSQLPLAAVAGSSLKDLRGRCRGNLELRINRQGVVDQFGLDVSVTDLEVLLDSGPELPVIPQAGLKLAASFDPVTEDLSAGLLRIDSASVRLPGIDMSASGSVTTDVLSGRLESLNQLQFAGKVYPDRLAALITGKTDLPGGIGVAGPVAVEVDLERRNTVVGAKLHLDAAGATVGLQGRTIKPAGETLDLVAELSLDQRDWRLGVDRHATKLLVGRNTFTGGGSISDLRRFSRSLADEARGPVERAARCLSCMDWQGSWDIVELDSLSELLKPLGRIAMDGPVRGKLSVTPFPDTRAQLSIVVPAETGLSFGDAFSKPPGGGDSDRPAPLLFDAVAKVRTDESSAELIDAHLVYGDSRVAIDGAVRDSWTGNSPALAVEGNLTGANVRSALELFPSVAGGQADISGDVTGRYRLDLSRSLLSAETDLDFRGLDIDCGRAFRKPAGEAARTAMNFSADMDGPLTGRARLNCSVYCEGGEATVAAATAGLDDGSAFDLSVDADVKDAGWLTASSPLLADAIDQTHLDGRFAVNASLHGKGGGVAMQATCDADGLGFASRAGEIGTKSRGTKLRISLSASADGGSARVERFSAALGDSTVEFTASAVLPGSDLAGAWRTILNSPDGSIGRATFDISADEALRDLLPRLSALAEVNGAGGRVRGSVGITCGHDGRVIDGKIDLTDLRIGGARLPIENPDVAAMIGTLCKPGGMPASVDFEGTLRADGRTAQLNNLHATVQDIVVLADGRFGLPEGEGASFGGTLGSFEAAHVSLWIPDASRLSALCPGLAGCEPSGAAFVEAQLAAGEDGALDLTVADFRAEQLAFTRLGEKCVLNGEVTAGNVLIGGMAAGDRPTGQGPRIINVGRCCADGVELGVGDSRAWVFADLADLPHAARGKVRVVASSLDDREIARLLPAAGPPTWELLPPDAEHAETRLTDEQTSRLLEEARKTTDSIRKHAAGAVVDFRASIDRLKTYDKSVDRSYEPTQFYLSASVDHGQFVASYVAGLNGGTMRGKYSGFLGDDEPTVVYETESDGVIATENIQPQFAKFFPGNTVNGLFNRGETSSAPLTSLLASAMDSRFPLRQSGTARTVATDGVVKGRAAPRFVTRIFPGLNLAEYDYQTMTSFATFRPDGLAENDMVFSGRKYDMYIEGTTDADNIGRYEIGLILLGSPQSAEWNHKYRQGRIPILKLKARIEGGQMHDEEVSYPWPNESLFVIFLRNNIFYRLWLVSTEK
jgi:hypothetical protein